MVLPSRLRGRALYPRVQESFLSRVALRNTVSTAIDITVYRSGMSDCGFAGEVMSKMGFAISLA